MDPKDLLALLEGEADVLTPEFERVFKDPGTCPGCGDRLEVVSNGRDLFKDAVALAYRRRCPGCATEGASGVL